MEVSAELVSISHAAPPPFFCADAHARISERVANWEFLIVLPRAGYCVHEEPPSSQISIHS